MGIKWFFNRLINAGIWFYKFSLACYFPSYFWLRQLFIRLVHSSFGNLVFGSGSISSKQILASSGVNIWKWTNKSITHSNPCTSSLSSANFRRALSPVNKMPFIFTAATYEARSGREVRGWDCFKLYKSIISDGDKSINWRPFCAKTYQFSPMTSLSRTKSDA